MTAQMNLEALSYQKKEGSLPLLPSLPPAAPPPIQEADPEGAISTSILFIISGGEKREIQYFQPINKTQRTRRLAIALATRERQGLNPQQIHDTAQQFLQQGYFTTISREKISLQPCDTIHLLQDVDEFEPSIHTLRQSPLAQTQWIVSNPCFEIWLFYHHFDDPSILAAGLSKPPAKRSQWLKQKLNTLKPGGFNPCNLHTLMETAIQNSQAHYTLKGNGLPDVFSTDMHLLASKIVSALGDEFNQMIQRRKQQAAEYKAHILGK